MNINFVTTLKNKLWIIFVRELQERLKSNEQILSKYSLKSTKSTDIWFLVILKVTSAGKLFFCDITVINGQGTNIFLKKKKCFFIKIFRFSCFGWICKLQNMWPYNRHYCIIKGTFACVFRILCSIKMKVSQLLK